MSQERCPVYTISVVSRQEYNVVIVLKMRAESGKIPIYSIVVPPESFGILFVEGESLPAVNRAVYGVKHVKGVMKGITNAEEVMKVLKPVKPAVDLDVNDEVEIVADTREFRKFAKRLRERRRKEGRIKQIASEMTKSPAVVITEELGKNPQEEMIGVEEKKAKKGVRKKVRKRELRHRVKQTPFKKLVRAVEDKARETGSAVFYVSSFRNSKVCPIHFDLLKNGGGWHVLHCPHGHAVDRDAAAVLNMLWKTTPTGWVKGIWWEVKEARKRLKKGIAPKEAVRKTNPIIPRPVAYAVWVSLKALKAGDKWPAVLARAAPMTPAQGTDEDGTRAPVSRPRGGNPRP